MFKYVIGMSLLLIITASPSHAKVLLVNYVSCNKVESKIDHIRDEQRKFNKAKRADTLNKLLREHRELLSSCKKKGFL